MVDVGGDDGAAARDFGSHELRRHEVWERRAEALPAGETRLGLTGSANAAEILAMRDIGHLLGDDAGAGEFELRHQSVRLRRGIVKPSPPSRGR